MIAVLLRTTLHKYGYFVPNHIVFLLFYSSKFVVEFRELDIQIRVPEGRLSLLFLPKPVLIIKFAEICPKTAMKFIIQLKSFVDCIILLLKETNVDTEQTQ